MHQHPTTPKSTCTVPITILAALLAVLTFTTAAGAACAWVLWEELFTVSGEGVSPKEWVIVATAEVPAACGKVAGDATKDRAARWKEHDTKVTINGNQVTVRADKTFFNYLPLPPRHRGSAGAEGRQVVMSEEGIISYGVFRLDDPPGFLECDGREVSRTTYAGLFAAIGTRFGAGDGETTFNLPSVESPYGPGTRAYINHAPGYQPFVGEIQLTAAINVSPGYLLCDGAAVSRQTYGELFRVIDMLYGAGDGVNTFNVPALPQQESPPLRLLVRTKGSGR
jgi:microcystin-dependent protein